MPAAAKSPAPARMRAVCTVRGLAAQSGRGPSMFEPAVLTMTSETRSVAGRVTALYRRAENAGQRRLGLALLVIAVSQLIVLMGTTIVTMALPRIQSALGFSATGLLWVVNLAGADYSSVLVRLHAGTRGG